MPRDAQDDDYRAAYEQERARLRAVADAREDARKEAESRFATQSCAGAAGCAVFVVLMFVALVIMTANK